MQGEGGDEQFSLSHPWIRIPIINLALPYIRSMYTHSFITKHNGCFVIQLKCLCIYCRILCWYNAFCTTFSWRFPRINNISNTKRCCQWFGLFAFRWTCAQVGIQYFNVDMAFIFIVRSIRAKHFLIHEDGTVKLSGLRSVVSMIEGGARVKVFKSIFLTILWSS